MNSTNKYKAKPIWWDLNKQAEIHPIDVEIYRCDGRLKTPNYFVRFDSHHEFNVYLELVRLYGKERVLRQHKIAIAEPGYCYPLGREWRVDFAITQSATNKTILKLVEAKGLFSREFGYILGMLETYDRSLFNRLTIVFSRSVPTKNKIVKALLRTDFRQNITTLSELQNKTTKL